MKTDIALRITGLILNVLGCPTGLFSIVKESITIGNEIKKDKKLSQKDIFVQKLIEIAKAITTSENCSSDVLENIIVTLSDTERFSAKKILDHFNDIEGYCIELTNSCYGNNSKTDPSAEGYKRAMEQLLTAIYNNLKTLGVASNAEEAILTKLYSYDSLLEENHDILIKLQYKDTFVEWLDKQELPTPIKGNIFNYCNPQIHFHGRVQELQELYNYVNEPGVSVWGITGLGGVGKSRLAREFANREKHSIKAVWLDSINLDKLSKFENYSYSQPVLFICDYSAKNEEKLKLIIEKIAIHPRENIKFLLLERQKKWYERFVNNNDLIKDLAYKESNEPKDPINLTERILDDEACMQIINDLRVSKNGDLPRYTNIELQSNEYAKIIAKAKEFSGEHSSVRCLFLLLLADAYFRNENIQKMSADDLLKNYINHSQRIISDQFDAKVTKIGFIILAYATARNEIQWEGEYPAIEEHLKYVMNCFPDDSESVNNFFGQISEEEKEGCVSALKPDIIGEYLFLHTWNNLFIKSKEKWMEDLLPEEFSRKFIARCLVDWPSCSEKLMNILSDLENDHEARFCCAKVFEFAIIEANSEDKKMMFVQKIKELDHEHSIYILSIYIEGISIVFDSSLKDTRAKCEGLVDQIDFEQYKCENDKEYLNIGILIMAVANIYCKNAKYDKALDFYKRIINIYEDKLGPKHTVIAMAYNNIGDIYRSINKYEKALEFYDKALTIYKATPSIEPVDKATVYNNIALVYLEMKKSDKALKYLEEAVPIFEKQYGIIHLKTAFVYNNLAMANKDINNLGVAREYYDKSLEIINSIIGVNNEHAATILYNLGELYLLSSDYDNSYINFEKSYKICKEVLGDNHNFTANSCIGLAGFYYDKGEYGKALKYAHEAEMIYESVFDENNLDTKNAYSLIAEIYKNLGNNEKTQEYEAKAGKDLKK